ncbi:hypothetical protein MAPG_09145 [Magnaporthiopsis poae ATCC 64411]|uniref:Heterokaryon incompatibility domain-containing protein n=1 Tax=Magnaporthiopsis poae (strain ATCC 64411 / 73-15) TaxID=644358 RepID=A0A0C4E966_MAGP6|nr:hypothetical protein MAPG_09145 [Magnaporthiopsis poae ATCC 64411]
MTLSHRWGGLTPVRLLQENYSDFRKGIAFDELPKTFRDAVEVTRRLGVSFLWIDSLCIIQDSVEDWARESSKMHRVYRNSYLNLAAGASPNSMGGLFYPRSLSGVPCRLPVGSDAQERMAISYYESEYSTRDSLILFTRGWVVQERLLAPRLLIFGQDAVHWDCSELESSEIFPGSQPRIESWEQQESHRFWQGLQTKAEPELLRIWARLVEAYSPKKLTNPTDKFVAIAGLAEDLGRIWGGEDYFAGMWAYRLRSALLWLADPPSTRRTRNIAPSWSWASLEGGVQMTIPEWCEGLVEILGVDSNPASSSQPFGSVTGGTIRLRGPLVKATLVRISPNAWDIDFLPDQQQKKEMAEVLDDPTISRKLVTTVRWDEEDMRDMARSVDVYFAPFEAGLNPRGVLQVRGLLLLPVYQQTGQFRRIGAFEVTESWQEGGEGEEEE